MKTLEKEEKEKVEKAHKHALDYLSKDKKPSHLRGLVSTYSKIELETIDKFLSKFTDTYIVKFRQQYKNRPIYGSSIIVELDEKDDDDIFVDSACVDLIGNIDVPPEPKIEPDALKDYIDKKVLDYLDDFDLRPSLYYYYDCSKEQEGKEIGKWRLVYITDIRVKKTKKPSNDKPLPEIVDYIVDAHTGDLVSQLPRVRTLD